MFVIITYDVEERRVAKVLKHLRKYLTWTQNSVFEGEITEGKLKKCLYELNRFINREYDSIYIYEVKIPHNIKKKIIGRSKSINDLFL